MTESSHDLTLPDLIIHWISGKITIEINACLWQDNSYLATVYFLVQSPDITREDRAKAPMLLN